MVVGIRGPILRPSALETSTFFGAPMESDKQYYRFSQGMLRSPFPETFDVLHSYNNYFRESPITTGNCF